LTVITDEVHKGRNLAAILRTCDAVGINSVHIVKPKSGIKSYRGTASGSEKWVRTELYESVATPIQKVRKCGFQIIAAHLSDTALDYRDIDYTKPTVILLGAEKLGLSQYAKDSVDHHISIPMIGMVASLNVSVAFAIIMAEARHQRTKANLSGFDQMPKAIYEQRLFEWCQPKLATYCNKHGLDYPDLNEYGDIVDSPNWLRSIKEKLSK
jgi:tRNA (guanosine-2'-O-)-methyltransferase